MSISNIPQKYDFQKYLRNPIVLQNVNAIIKNITSRKLIELIEFKNEYWIHCDNEMLKIMYSNCFSRRYFFVYQFLKEYSDWMSTGTWIQTCWTPTITPKININRLMNKIELSPAHKPNPNPNQIDKINRMEFTPAQQQIIDDFMTNIVVKK